MMPYLADRATEGHLPKITYQDRAGESTQIAAALPGSLSMKLPQTWEWSRKKWNVPSILLALKGLSMKHRVRRYINTESTATL